MATASSGSRWSSVRLIRGFPLAVPRPRRGSERGRERRVAAAPCRILAADLQPALARGKGFRSGLRPGKHPPSCASESSARSRSPVPTGSPSTSEAPSPGRLLTLLLADAGRVVGIDRIVSTLWGDDPPPTVTGTLQAYVSHLRRVLEPDRGPREAPTVLLTRPPGYLLQVDAGDLDLLRFTELVESGRPRRGRRRPRPAASPCWTRRWRSGAASRWPSSATCRRAGTDRLRLTELHVRARERRCDALLGVGRADAAVTDLQHLVAEHPLRERLWARLVTALYAADRQAEALEALPPLRRAAPRGAGHRPRPGAARPRAGRAAPGPEAARPHPPPADAGVPRTRAGAVPRPRTCWSAAAPSSPTCGPSPSRSVPAGPPSSSSRARPASARPGWPRPRPRRAGRRAGRSPGAAAPTTPAPRRSGRGRRPSSSSARRS